jgi:hypothetical protein
VEASKLTRASASAGFLLKGGSPSRNVPPLRPIDYVPSDKPLTTYHVSDYNDHLRQLRAFLLLDINALEQQIEI